MTNYILHSIRLLDIYIIKLKYCEPKSNLQQFTTKIYNDQH